MALLFSQNYPYTARVNFRIFSPLRNPVPVSATPIRSCHSSGWLFSFLSFWTCLSVELLYIMELLSLSTFQSASRWMACIYRILSLWPNSIPWCGQTSCYLSIHPLLGILKCFHFGAGVRDYAMNVHAQIFFLVAVLLSVYLEKEPSLVIALLGSGQVHLFHSLKSERLKEATL